MRLHIHFPPAKAHALSLQPEPLLHRGITSQLDLPACPSTRCQGNPKPRLQYPRHHPRRSRQSRGPRNRTIG